MAAQLVCDGCGEVIREGGTDTRARLRLFVVKPGNIFTSFDHEKAWDFCDASCLATWAVDYELKADIT